MIYIYIYMYICINTHIQAGHLSNTVLALIPSFTPQTRMFQMSVQQSKSPILTRLKPQWCRTCPRSQRLFGLILKICRPKPDVSATGFAPRRANKACRTACQAIVPASRQAASMGESCMIPIEQVHKPPPERNTSRHDKESGPKPEQRLRSKLPASSSVTTLHQKLQAWGRRPQHVRER